MICYIRFAVTSSGQVTASLGDKSKLGYERPEDGIIIDFVGTEDACKDVLKAVDNSDSVEFSDHLLCENLEDDEPKSVLRDKVNKLEKENAILKAQINTERSEKLELRRAFEKAQKYCNFFIIRVLKIGLYQQAC